MTEEGRKQMSWTNHDALHRHACHAYEDFIRLRRVLERGITERITPEESDLWHSLSHHLRHAVHRSGHEVSDDRLRIKDVRRSDVSEKHR